MIRITTALIMLALLLAPAPARAQAPAGLDQPLAMANMCGDGAEAHFTIAATGDTFPHENIQAVGEAQGYDVLFDYVRPFLRAADLAYTNFDGAMLEGAGYTGYPMFNFNPALAPALRNAGIGLVSTANNHILDRGPEGIDATLRVLEAAGIQQHGAVPQGSAARPPYLPVTLSRDGASITIGFISATWGTNGIPDPQGQVNLLYESSEYGQQGGVRQSVLDAIARAAAETDLVLVAAHWGYEYQFYPHPSQIDAARSMAAAGADIILGAQPHTLQPVELIDSGGRTTLVIYSLANFLASQGAYQAQYFSATSVIFYVGLARAADGSVRVTGYRYLPTIHVDSDTRPAPIPPGAYPEVIAHVRAIMRDPAGARQLPADQPAGPVAVCPSLTLAEAPAAPIPGDFAQLYATLGGEAPRPLTDAIAALGLPLGPVVNEPAGDCVTPARVLYTERQRLELNPALAWPYRVTGSQLGLRAFERAYPGTPAQPRTDLGAPDAFADPRFRSFFEQYGGLPIFGYPVSGPLSEDDALSGAPTTVQYFERARFELAPGAPPDAPLTDQVRLGLLGRELGGLAGLCAGAAPGAAAVAASDEQALAAAPDEQALAAGADALGWVVGTLAQIGGENSWLIPTLAVAALLVALVALIGFAVADWRAYRRRGPHKGYRRRRSAHERFAPRAAPEPPAGPRQVTESWEQRGGWADAPPPDGYDDELAPAPPAPAAARGAYGLPDEPRPTGYTPIPGDDLPGGPFEPIAEDEFAGASFRPLPEEPPARPPRAAPRRPAPPDDDLLRELLGQ